MANQTFTIKNLSTNTSAVINRFTFADQSGVQHNVDFTGWNSPWNSGYSTANDTQRQYTKTYIDDIQPENAVFVDQTVEPTDNALYAVTWESSTFVAAGQGGLIFTSTDDGDTWTPRTSGTANQINDLTSGGIFIAVGNNGTILTSASGTTWSIKTSGTSQDLYGIVTYGGSIYVAVGDNGTILSSPDTNTWTAQTSGVSTLLTGIVWDGSQFVVTGYSGTILTSPDAITWTAQTSGTSNNLNDIYWDGTRFTAVGDSGTILTSSDGISWTSRSSGTSTDLRSVGNGGGYIVAIGDSGVIVSSPSGVSWSSENSTIDKNLYSIVTDGSIIIVVGAAGSIIASTNGGQTWNLKSLVYVIVDSTTDIQDGWTLSGNGYTQSQTVISVTSATWINVSNYANGIPIPSEVITFNPSGGMTYILQVSNISSLDTGWAATGNGYNGQTIVSFSGTNWIEMSGPPATTPTPGGSVTFTESDANMWTIPPLDTKTFLVDYTNLVSTFGNYTGDIQITADVGGTAIKNVNNIITISAAPVPPESPYYDGSTGSGSGGGSQIPDPGPGGPVWTDSNGNPILSADGTPWTAGDYSTGVSSSSKIVCTAMNNAYGFGSFRQAIWLRYAEKNLRKEHELGYHAIFLPLVKFGFESGNGLMNRIVRRILEHIARHRSVDLRAEMRNTRRDRLGQIYRSILEPICFLVGKIKMYKDKI